MKISIDVELSFEQVIGEIMAAGHEEAERAILAIDLAIADAGFTEELIVRLWNSLRGDLSPEELDAIRGRLDV